MTSRRVPPLAGSSPWAVFLEDGDSAVLTVRGRLARLSRTRCGRREIFYRLRNAVSVRASSIAVVSHRGALDGGVHRAERGGRVVSRAFMR